MNASLSIKYLLIFLLSVLSVYSCTSQSNVEVTKVDNHDLSYLLSNLYIDDTFRGEEKGYVITVFNFGDPQNTKQDDFPGTDEVLQKYIFNIQPDGEFSNEYCSYEFTSKMSLNSKSYRFTIENGECVVNATYMNGDKMNCRFKLP